MSSPTAGVCIWASPGSHYLPRLIGTAPLDPLPPALPLNCKYWILLSSMANANFLFIYFFYVFMDMDMDKHEHVQHRSNAQRRRDNYSLSWKGWKTFSTAVFLFLWYILVASWVCVCTARKGEYKLVMFPIQLCKIGLVLNGVHQFLPVVQWEA